MRKPKQEFKLVDLSGETSAEVFIVKPLGKNRSPYLRITSMGKTVLMTEDDYDWENGDPGDIINRIQNTL